MRTCRLGHMLPRLAATSASFECVVGFYAKAYVVFWVWEALHKNDLINHRECASIFTAPAQLVVAVQCLHMAAALLAPAHIHKQSANSIN